MQHRGHGELVLVGDLVPVSALMIPCGEFDENHSGRFLSLSRSLDPHPSKVHPVTFVIFIEICELEGFSIGPVHFGKELEFWESFRRAGRVTCWVWPQGHRPLQGRRWLGRR